MPLSEHEQRILDEIERRLAAEDPKFARSATMVTPRGVALRQAKRAGAVFFFGLALLVVGLLAGMNNAGILIALGLSGFVVMLLALVSIAKASKAIGRAPSAPRNATWFKRAEERWKDRFERGEDR